MNPLKRLQAYWAQRGCRHTNNFTVYLWHSNAPYARMTCFDCDVDEYGPANTLESKEQWLARNK